MITVRRSQFGAQPLGYGLPELTAQTTQYRVRYIELLKHRFKDFWT
jgi:hypothetical protein